MLSVALVATLTAMTSLPGRSDAQVVVYPSVTASAYAYAGYCYHSFGYSSGWTGPYSSMYSPAWSNPFNYGTWTWYTPSHNYTGYNYGNWPSMGGWRSRYYYRW